VAENHQRYLKTFRVARKDIFLIVLAPVLFAISNWYWPGRYKLATEARFNLSPELSHFAFSASGEEEGSDAWLTAECVKCHWERDWNKNEYPVRIFDMLSDIGKHRC
jgi:hypothetical protein